MQPYIEFLGVIGKMLGLMLLVVLVMTGMLMLFLDIWVKRKSLGHVWCFFWSNRLWEAHLLKEDLSLHCVWMGSGEDKEKYELDDANQGWARWPPLVPMILQVPIRTYEFFRNQPDARALGGVENGSAVIDSVAGSVSTLTARAKRMVEDEVMLKTTWRDARESLGLGSKVAPTSMLLLMILIVVVILSGFGLYLSLQNTKALQDIVPVLQGLFPK